MKTILVSLAILYSSLCQAEIIIEYKVTALKDNPFLEEFEVLPHKMVLTIGEDFAKIETPKIDRPNWDEIKEFFSE